MSAEHNPTNLKRVLGRWDLVLLFVVAVFNLNVVPSIAANGGVTVWLWIIALILFFWPQGIAVIELAHRYPGEGGVYLWAKEVFGDFHGFLSGWCYWTNNMLYVPTVMLYFVGVSVYVLGPSHQGLADNKIFALATSTVLLAVLTWLNIVGLGVGKWINNLGAIGTGIAAAVLIGLGIVLWQRFGTTLTAADFRIPADPRFVLNSFGVICFGLVGLELASVMGDEIRDPARTLPGAVVWGGILSGALYVGVTLTLLIAVGKKVSVLQGIVQAVSHMAAQVGVAWIVIPFALMLSLSIAGIGSAWMGGSARIPFVAGLDAYMPGWLGSLHPRYATPYAALIVQGLVSLVLVIVNFAAAGGVQAAFQTMLSIAVVLQLVPFIYMFAALLKLAFKTAEGEGHYSRRVLIMAGSSGLITTIVAIVVAFFPASQITSVLKYELSMFGLTLFFLALAAFFFFVYGRKKLSKLVHVGTAALGRPVEPSSTN
ncbi:MAG TPA: APC family permease [Terriglobales bacterium]|jgi:amino acid transporter|nr:APC family permease [Terriglobales bacterium]